MVKHVNRESPKKKKTTKATDLKRTSNSKPKRVAKVKGPTGIRTPWSLFLAAKSSEPQYKDVKSSERMKQIAVIWKGLSDEKKAPYVRASLEDKARYNREVSALTDEERTALAANSRSRRKAKQTKRAAEYKLLGIEPPPKQASTAYLLFSKQQHAENRARPDGEKVGFKDMCAQISDEWNEMSDADKAPYQEEYKKNLLSQRKARELWDAKYAKLKAAAKQQRQEEMRRGHEKAVEAMTTD